jgi:hypothetical protein
VPLRCGLKEKSYLNKRKRIIQKWNDIRPKINPLLYQFDVQLAGQRIINVHSVFRKNNSTVSLLSGIVFKVVLTSCAASILG